MTRQINWYEKRQPMGICGDVYVSLTKDKTHKYTRATISFRNNKWKHFGDYVQVGISDNRLYFMDSNSKVGYKLSETGNDYVKNIQVSVTGVVDWCRNAIGEYTLRKDDEVNLYYIEVTTNGND